MWTAVSLALAYGAIFLVYGAWAASRIASGGSVWLYLAALPFVYLVVPLLFVIAWFAFAHHFAAERPEDAHLDTRGKVTLFWQEFLTIAGNSPRMIFYRVLIHEPAPSHAQRPVLLVHGVLCNAGVWHPMKRWLSAHGIAPIYTLSYGPPLASIDHFAQQAARKIDSILAETGARDVIVIAHSMGGLVMRAYLREHGGRKIARLVTIATPHEGSMHAWLGTGVSVAQMRPGSAWLSALGEPRSDDAPPLVSLWSWHDSMVTPQTSARVAFGENVELSGVGHTALLRERRVFERVLQEIQTARATSESPA
ncbi:MAG TPA: alpha/beta fold hydrolase [Casimicrobiaceae bacterium]|nr:alpha/beta fold hydrolase [Casimicrobiaceae bacterium]